jgi:hypothetical protein
MCLQLSKAIAEIIKMPYHTNDTANTYKGKHGHEHAIICRFTDQGFSKFVYVKKTKRPRKAPPKKLDSIPKAVMKNFARTNDPTRLLEFLEDMTYGSYIHQPCGSHSPPDFLVRDFNGVFYAIEGKSSSKGDKTMFNDSLAEPTVIYVFSSKITGPDKQTTVFLGRDVIDPACYAHREALNVKLTKCVEEERDIMNAKGIPSTFNMTYRVQNFQLDVVIGSPERGQREANVMAFLSE